MFPAFMVGDKSTCRRKLKAEAKKWAKHYLAGREFPEPKLVPLGPGSVVFVEPTTAALVGMGFNIVPNTNIALVDSEAAQLERRNIQCRAFVLDDLQSEIEKAAKLFDRDEAIKFRHAFITFVCQFAWGAISATTMHFLYNSVGLTCPRFEGLLRHWDTLDQLKYINMDTHPISLSALMASDFCGQITMWVDRPTGNVRTDLQSAIEQMRLAPPDEIYTRLVQCLRKLVNTERSLKQRDWLRSPGIIERGLEVERQQDQWQYDELTSGQDSALGRFLLWLGRNYGPGGEFTLP